MKKIGLHWWIFIGIAVGVLWGLALHLVYFDAFEASVRLEILGPTYTPQDEVDSAPKIQSAIEAAMKSTFWGGLADGLSRLFLTLLRMIVIPLVVASLICGVTRMRDFGALKRIGARAAGWYLTTSALAIMVGLVLVNVIAPGVGRSVPFPTSIPDIATPQNFWDMLLAFVPQNVFQSAASFELLPLIFFSILFGVFLLTIDDERRDPVERLFEGILEVMMKMTHFIIGLAPVGIAALIAKLLATTGIGVFATVGGYALTVALGLMVHAFITLPLVFFVLTRRNPYRVMAGMSLALVTAFSTASSAGTLAVTLERLQERVGVSPEVASFVAPLGATVNMDGTALYECVAVIFVAQLFVTTHPEFVLTAGTQFTIVFLALMVSIGAAGIPHAGLVMMVIIFEAVGLPLELVGILWAVDRPLDMGRTMVNVWSDSIGATTIAHFEGAIDEKVFSKSAVST